MEMLRAEHLFPGCRVQVDERWRVVAAVEFPDPDHVRFCVGQAWFSCGLSVEWRAIVPNARLWFWWNGWVKLTIRPEKSLQFGECHATDEGHSYCSEVLHHEGWRVVREHASGGSDCDGPIDHESVSVCLYSDLRSIPADSDEYGENPPRANWVTLSRCQRDHYAEAMGY
jgi:hypothetical protein